MTGLPYKNQNSMRIAKRRKGNNMKIKAKSKLDYKTVKAFVRAGLFRKSLPARKLAIYCAIAVLLAAVIGFEIYLLGPTPTRIIMLCIAGCMLLLELYLYFIVPRLRYNALGQLKGCVNEFVFREDYMLVASKDNGFDGESRIDYKVLSKVIETGKYFYIFHSRNQGTIVEKSTLSGGTCLELRNLLQEILKDRYQIYKY